MARSRLRILAESIACVFRIGREPIADPGRRPPLRPRRALKINLPTYFNTHEAFAAVYGHGEQDAARNAARDLRAPRPDFASAVRDEIGRWLCADRALLSSTV